MPEKTLYVSDLDGTLLGRDDKLSAFTIETLERLVKDGMFFTYATARSFHSSVIVTKGLEVNIPIVVYNGVFILETGTGELLSSSLFHPGDAEAARGIFECLGVFPLVYSLVAGEEKVSWLPRAENEGIRRYLANRQNDRRLRPVENEAELYQGAPFYYTCIGEKEDLVPVYEVFNALPAYRCTLQQELYRPEYWCEIMPAEATKARAVLRLKELLGCGRVVSFGDAVNDIPLFEASDECYAVGNAVDELKKIASGIILSNEEDGVARWLIEHAVL